jgi:glycosyltransferase involved in cell wall biosynthesis
MRILNVTQAYYPFLEKGGPTVKVRAMARGLAARGHHVTVLTADLGLDPATQQRIGAVREPWGIHAIEDGVEAIYLPVLGRYRAITWNRGALRWCRKNSSSFDMVHIYGLYDLLGPVAAHVRSHAGLPYVVEPMGMFRPIVRNIPLKRLYRRLFGDRVLQKAHSVVATSEQERSELEAGGIPLSKIVVRRNGIDVPSLFPAPGEFRKRLDITPNVKLVLFLGRLVQKKCPELAIEAFADWRGGSGDETPAILVLAGPEEESGYARSLESLANKLGLGGKVLFPGALYENAKWAAYRDADVFVLPSQNENFGNTAGESVACGTPVLVTDRCGIAPLVEGRAGLSVPFERGAFGAALGRILDDDALRARLRAGCADVALSLGWEEPLAETEALYSLILGEGNRE